MNPMKWAKKRVKDWLIEEMLSRFPEYGFTDHSRSLIEKYCRGHGIEIGPGRQPYCDPERTVFLDKFSAATNQPRADKNQPRIDIVSEAFEIPRPDNSFDFLLSAHCLEHCPDTLRTLHEWKRVVKNGGVIVLILPHGLRTFDKGRTLTRLPHHLVDLENKVDYRDTTHFEEFQRISIPSYKHHWIPEAQLPDGSFDFQYIVSQGHLHYHVWTQTEMIEIMQHLGCDTLVAIEELEERKDSFMLVSRVKK